MRRTESVIKGLDLEERRRIEHMVIVDLYERMKTAPVVLTRGRRRTRRGRFR